MSTETIQIIIGISTVLILAATLLVIHSYTKETKKLRDINERILELESEKLEPNVIAYFDSNPKGFDIIFIVHNTGGSLAKNIKLMVEPKFSFGHDKIDAYINDNKVIKEGLLILNSNEKFELIVGYTSEAEGLYKKEEIPNKYQVTVKFENLAGDLFERNFHLAIDQFFYRIVESDKTEKVLKEINKTLTSISEKIK